MAGEIDDFSTYPRSIAEVRSDKTGNASQWTPRDALIDTLRQIDSGELNPDALTIVYRETTGPGVTNTGWRCAGPDLTVTLGMLTYAQIRMSTHPKAEA